MSSAVSIPCLSLCTTLHSMNKCHIILLPPTKFVFYLHPMKYGERQGRGHYGSQQSDYSLLKGQLLHFFIYFSMSLGVSEKASERMSVMGRASEASCAK